MSHVLPNITGQTRPISLESDPNSGFGRCPIPKSPIHKEVDHFYPFVEARLLLLSYLLRWRLVLVS